MTGKPKQNLRSPKPRGRQRLSPSMRQQMILDAAIDYFAENGFSARIRELAGKIGVSQALIFRYFGNKEELIERVYEKTFLSRWNPEWEAILQDRSLPLRNRLIIFYRSYFSTVDERRWIRIAMLASLAGRTTTKRYVHGPVMRLISVIAGEMREYKQFKKLDEEFLLELVLHLHSTFIYYLIRKHIYGSPLRSWRAEIIDLIVDNFLGLGKNNAEAIADLKPATSAGGRRFSVERKDLSA